MKSKKLNVTALAIALSFGGMSLAACGSGGENVKEDKTMEAGAGGGGEEKSCSGEEKSCSGEEKSCSGEAEGGDAGGEASCGAGSCGG